MQKVLTCKFLGDPPSRILRPDARTFSFGLLANRPVVRLGKNPNYGTKRGVTSYSDASLNRNSLLKDEQSMSDESEIKRRERNALLVLLILLGFEVGRFVTRTAVPVIMISQLGGDTSGSLRLLNQLAAGSALLEFMANPVMGSMSDRRGRRPFLIGGTVATFLSFLSVTVCPTIVPLVISRLVLTASPVLNMCHASAAVSK
eukprot:jgi/Bigna1/139610/aug1.51_g14318